MTDTQSILTSVKKLLGIDESYTVFDTDVMLHINSVFSTLQQLGVGPSSGYAISDSTGTWGDFIGASTVINNVKSYMFLRVKLLFDPPATSFALDAMSLQIKELEWRMNVAADRAGILPEDSGQGEQGMLWDLTGGKDFPLEAPLGAYGIDTATGIVWRKA
jgi:hypothetical protein